MCLINRECFKVECECFRLNNISHATNAKSEIEQRQRDEAQRRKDQGLSWETKVMMIIHNEYLLVQCKSSSTNLDFLKFFSTLYNHIYYYYFNTLQSTFVSFLHHFYVVNSYSSQNS